MAFRNHSRRLARYPHHVMAGPRIKSGGVPAIHAAAQPWKEVGQMDARIKSAHDDVRSGRFGLG